MTMLATVLAVILAALGLLHAYWGVGGVWPGVDAADCARRVGGFRGSRAMPGPAACFTVAGALFAAAITALASSGAFGGKLAHLAAVPAIVVTLVFLGRGIAGFTPTWRALTPEQPFATLDLRYYSPLCLAIGAGFAVLATLELTR